MFGVTQYSCATGYYTFGHELGHNLGMLHDRGTHASCSEITTFNYGFRDPNAEFRTMLSYDCKMAQCDLMPKDGCPRIQRFSNSNTAYTYNGKPIGNSRSDNAKQLNDVRALVASFFPAMNCQSDNECNDSNSNTTDICNTAKRVCVFTPVGTPTRAPSRSPTTSVPVQPPTKAPTQTRAPIPVSSPVVQNTPTLRPISIAPSNSTSQLVPTLAPIVIVDEPVSGQEQLGFFSMIFRFFGDFWVRLFSGR